MVLQPSVRRSTKTEIAKKRLGECPKEWGSFPGQTRIAWHSPHSLIWCGQRQRGRRQKAAWKHQCHRARDGMRKEQSRSRCGKCQETKIISLPGQMSPGFPFHVPSDKKRLAVGGIQSPKPVLLSFSFLTHQGKISLDNSGALSWEFEKEGYPSISNLLAYCSHVIMLYHFLPLNIRNEFSLKIVESFIRLHAFIC